MTMVMKTPVGIDNFEENRKLSFTKKEVLLWD